MRCGAGGTLGFGFAFVTGRCLLVASVGPALFFSLEAASAGLAAMAGVSATGADSTGFSTAASGVSVLASSASALGAAALALGGDLATVAFLGAAAAGACAAELLPAAAASSLMNFSKTRSSTTFSPALVLSSYVISYTGLPSLSSASTWEMAPSLYCTAPNGPSLVARYLALTRVPTGNFTIVKDDRALTIARQCTSAARDSFALGA